MKNTKSLSEIQSALQHAILTRTFPHLLVSEVSEKPPISTERRIEIYQDAYQIRMVESLREDFPTVEQLLNENVQTGKLEKDTDFKSKNESEFESIAIEFLNLYPSKYRNLAEVSQNFPDFLKVKSTNLYEAALRDWLLVLVNNAADPEEDKIVSIEDIQNGGEFLIKKHPASLTAATDTQYLLAYRQSTDPGVIETTENKIKLINYLESARTLEEFSNKSFELGFSESELSLLLSDWMSKEITFCERKSK